MQDSQFPDILGILGMVFAVLGIAVTDAQPTPRLSCLFLSAICLSISFRSQIQWPSWVRWLLLFAANSILAFAGWSLIRIDR